LNGLLEVSALKARLKLEGRFLQTRGAGTDTPEWTAASPDARAREIWLLSGYRGNNGVRGGRYVGITDFIKKLEL